MSRNLPVVVVLGLSQIVAFASSYYLLGVLADPIATEFGVPPAGIFLALSVAFLLAAVLTPAGGRLIEAHGGRQVLILAHLAFGGALLLMASAAEPWLLYVGVAALGLGMAVGLYGTAFAVLVELHGDGARRPITAVSLMGAFGGMVGWPVSRLAVDAWDWRTACLIWAVIHLAICVPLVVRILPRRPQIAPEDRRAPAPIRWDRRMVQLAVLFAGAWMVATAMAAHLPRLLTSLGMTPVHAAWAAGAMAGCAILARVVDLTLLHRSHPILTARLAALCHPIGALVAAVGGSRLAPAIAVGQGVGNGFLAVASGVLPLHVFGADRYAVRQALLLTPARYLQAAAPAGYALALGISTRAAMILTSLICLMMFAATFGLRR
ncbi:MFS transporter [Brevundimonas sp.]|uniref:MFS transporter n=1 Tax=Brevundimonas sp. TaxID=1871086 RepID=UPI0035AE357F